MNEQVERAGWAEVTMYVVAGAAGVALGALGGLWMRDAVAGESPFFWFVTRAAAIVAYLLLWLSTAWGVTLSSKGLGGRVSGALAYTLHNITSWLALGFTVAHVVTLLGDASAPFTLAGLLVPFAPTYEPLLVGLGSVSLYALVIVTAAFYMRKRLGLRVWRTIHGLSYLTFGAVTVHSIALGTDTSALTLKSMYLVAGVSVALLTVFRLLTAKRARRSGMSGAREVATT